ncbi:alpha-amylase family glycosyl hydrolase [Mesomycoplasma neurolyticum]|uniref:Oligo-1,6-glucosidase 1 n=1 Tax=Mesomycoplasma neurolyticum TaxID=2120 RepID=A0A449A4S2_9BACT|nr:alpha-amylase family glycosyl hydrolase [Mesomycoplasma neurolyticum]VEU59280.1 Oligo-1,6-glucosidase 1 [Mesomycoplasma neurolyticum]
MENKKLWWRTGTIYQVYLRSFKDSNNDGNGDLKGLISKLDYIEQLGVNAIWLNPIAQSPMVDNGYDVTNYKKIDPMFGTMQDFEELVKKAHQKNIKIIWDFPLNHCSDQHEWFQKALKGDPKYFNYFYFTKKFNLKRKSLFGGEFWTKAKNGYYYAHVFAKEQPCLNWYNHDVVNEFIDIMDFWLKKGVDGFRLDAFDEIGKPKDLFTRTKMYKHDTKFVIEKFKQIRQKLWKDNDEIMVVSESGAMDKEETDKYTTLKNKNYSLIINFEHITSEFEVKVGRKIYKGFDLVKFKKIISDWQTKVKNGWNTLYFSNHDQGRQTSRFVSDQNNFFSQKAKAIALTLHGLKGTPFLYQGEEIGMDNSTHVKNLKKINDVMDHKTYKQDVIEDKVISHHDYMKLISIFSRDNSRTPMPWNSDGGFNDIKKSWLPYNLSYKTINVENQINDPNSVLNWYKKIISLRKDSLIKEIILWGDFKLLLKENKNIFAFKRKYQDHEIVFVINWSQNMQNYNLNLKNYDVFLNNYQQFEKNILLPWQALIFTKKRIGK